MTLTAVEIVIYIMYCVGAFVAIVNIVDRPRLSFLGVMLMVPALIVEVIQ